MLESIITQSAMTRQSSILNKQIFDALLKEIVERDFGETLSWERLDDRRPSRVAAYRPGTIEDEDRQLAEIGALAVGRLLRLKRVFAARVRDIVQKLGSDSHVAFRPRRSC